MRSATEVSHRPTGDGMALRSSAPTADLARGSVLSLAGSTTGAAMGLLLVIVLGNLLGGRGTGVAFQAIAIFTIALAMARCGMDSAALWLLPRLRDDASSALRPAVALMVAIAGLGGLICAVVLDLGATALAHNSDAPVASAVAATAWGLPLAAMMVTALGASRALGGVRAYVLVGNIGLPVLRVGAVAIAAAVGLSVTGIAASWTLPLVPAVVVALAVVTRQLPRVGSSTPVDRPALLGRITRFGMPRILASVLEQLLLWLDVVVVGMLAGPAAAGVYGAASRLVMAGMVVDSAIRVVVSPWFSRLIHREDLHSLAQVFRTATSWLVLFSTPIYLLLACFAPLPLSLIGGEFVSGAMALTILCLGAVVTFLAGNVHSLLLMSGRSGLAAMNKVIAVGTNLVLLVVLVPRWGVTGAAVAWAVATLLDAVIAGVQVRVLMRLPVDPIAGLYPLAVAVLTCGVPALVCRLTLGATWWSLALAVVIGLVGLLSWASRSTHRLHLDALVALARRPSPEGTR